MLTFAERVKVTTSGVIRHACFHPGGAVTIRRYRVQRIADAVSVVTHVHSLAGASQRRPALLWVAMNSGLLHWASLGVEP